MTNENKTNGRRKTDYGINCEVNFKRSKTDRVNGDDAIVEERIILSGIRKSLDLICPMYIVCNQEEETEHGELCSCGNKAKYEKCNEYNPGLVYSIRESVLDCLRN